MALYLRSNISGIAAGVRSLARIKSTRPKSASRHDVTCGSVHQDTTFGPVQSSSRLEATTAKYR